MKPKQVISTIILVGTCSFIAGILYAPEKGSRIRRRIYEKGEDSCSNLKYKISRLFRKLEKNPISLF